MHRVENCFFSGLRLSNETVCPFSSTQASYSIIRFAAFLNRLTLFDFFSLANCCLCLTLFICITINKNDNNETTTSWNILSLVASIDRMQREKEWERERWEPKIKTQKRNRRLFVISIFGRWCTNMQFGGKFKHKKNHSHAPNGRKQRIFDSINKNAPQSKALKLPLCCALTATAQMNCSHFACRRIE